MNLLEIGRKIWGEIGRKMGANFCPKWGSLVELGRRRKMEKLAPEAGPAAGNRPENLGGKWRRYRCWGRRKCGGRKCGGKRHLALCFLADPKFGGKWLATLERDGRETDKSLTFSISPVYKTLDRTTPVRYICNLGFFFFVRKLMFYSFQREWMEIFSNFVIWIINNSCNKYEKNLYETICSKRYWTLHPF